MKKFYIITNTTKDKDFNFTEKLAHYIRNKGGECICQKDNLPDKSDEFRYTDHKDIPQDTECIIVLGGDGTLIQAAGDVNNTNIPLLGVNIGTLGYLTDADRVTAYDAIDKLIDNQYEIDERMMLSGTVYRDGNKIYENIALNDIVINRCGILRVIDFDVLVNNEYLNSYSADGLIISTATGSTAYSLSAGGPVIQPNAKLIMITPICPHSLNQRSIIFGDEDKIMIRMNDNKGLKEERVATYDGEMMCNMITGDVIVIKKSDKVARFIKTNKVSFLQRIRNKM